MAMSSSTPYLLRAVNEWILDNQYTPYLIVDALVEGTEVPSDYVKDGQIVLNISPGAVRNLVMGNDFILFSGRFDGVASEIVVPLKAVLGLVAKENGEGMWFPREDPPPDSPEDNRPDPAPRKLPPRKGTPDLKVIK